ncbi:MAG TPA: GNAT family N-acetyltransferase [Candidatus Absconditabacterales bacterium]|nr:GNAT family N-acetyltransferase [Candidatus Absconditabacterales bacterium]HNG97131.1 GNAT family N-acetyltransferase [Candidatus Absconditabacterales bacterium]
MNKYKQHQFILYDGGGDFDIDEYLDTLTNLQYDSYIEYALMCGKSSYDRSYQKRVVDQIKKREELFDTILKGNSYALLLESKYKKGVGFWRGRYMDNECFESCFVYVDPAWRGNGHGKLLKEHQILYAKELGYKYIESTTIHSNYIAQALLQTTGHSLKPSLFDEISARKKL